jgi:hypothetical protein
MQGQPTLPPPSDYIARSGFDDVWESDEALCPACAAQVGDLDRCPACGRRLTEKRLRYPRSSPEHTIYFVLVLGAGNLLLVQLLVDLVLGAGAAVFAWHAILAAFLVLMAGGVFLRRPWSQVGSIAALLVVLGSALFAVAAGKPVEEHLAGLGSREFFLTLAADLDFLAASGVQTALRLLQLAAAGLGLGYGMLRAGPDFQRESTRTVATLRTDLSDPAEYYLAGKDYAARGMWATAVLHWRMAAGLEPWRTAYRQTLADGYARLGFHERAASVLESAGRFTHDLARASEGRVSAEQPPWDGR